MNVNANNVPQITLSTGQKIPCIGMGTFGSDRFTAEQVSNAVAGAIRAGYRMFDCAACYGNEDQIGEVFQAAYGTTVFISRQIITGHYQNLLHRFSIRFKNRL